MIDRILNLKLPAGQSAFLWGPRKTGKSTYLREKFPESIRYDFLDSELFLALSARPGLLWDQLRAQPASKLKLPVILDEVQKIPGILDEVHRLIENHSLSFILCGSSARKLKRSHTNMLGGRAWRFELYPLTFAELGDVQLLRVLNQGLIPQHYTAEPEVAGKHLQAYLLNYLKEEIFEEGLTRNIPAFSRFFQMLSHSHGELINYSKIATDCGVSSKTIKSYFEILADTLVGDFVLPFHQRAGRAIISKTPKFYLFDVGVAGALSRQQLSQPVGEAFGKALEHYIWMEIKAYLGYHDLPTSITYWRTKTGLEVDFILNHGQIAIEVKASSAIRSTDIKALQAFHAEHSPRRSIIICQEPLPRMLGPIEVMPWKYFLEELWVEKVM